VLRTFQTPSAFSLYILRLDNPTRKSSAGWNDVQYNNIPLSTFRRRLSEKDADQDIRDIEQPIGWFASFFNLLDQSYDLTPITPI
jgi:hypothetical protein